LKNRFQQPVRAVQGGIAHFSNTQVFEKWSKAKIALIALRADQLRRERNGTAKRRRRREPQGCGESKSQGWSFSESC
jgi:hypothetical protein